MKQKPRNEASLGLKTTRTVPTKRNLSPILLDTVKRTY